MNILPTKYQIRHFSHHSLTRWRRHSRRLSVALGSKERSVRILYFCWRTDCSCVVGSGIEEAQSGRSRGGLLESGAVDNLDWSTDPRGRGSTVRRCWSVSRRERVSIPVPIRIPAIPVRRSEIRTRRSSRSIVIDELHSDHDVPSENLAIPSRRSLRTPTLRVRNRDPVPTFSVGRGGENFAKLGKVGDDEGEGVGGETEDVDGIASLRRCWERGGDERGGDCLRRRNGLRGMHRVAGT